MIETCTSSMLDTIVAASQLEAAEREITHDSYTTNHPLSENEIKLAALCEIARRNNISIAEAAKKVNIIAQTPPVTPKKTKEAYELLMTTGKPTFILTNYRIEEGRHWAIIALTKDQNNSIAVTHINSGIKAKAVESKDESESQSQTIGISKNSHLRIGEIEDFVSDTIAVIQRLHNNGAVVGYDFSVNRQHAECCGLTCAMSVGEVAAVLDQGTPIAELWRSQRALTNTREREIAYSSMARRIYYVLESLSTEANKNKRILTLETLELHRANLITKPKSRTATSIDALLVARETQRVRQLAKFRSELEEFAESSTKNYNDKIALKTYLERKYVRYGIADLKGYKQEKEVITIVASRNFWFSTKGIIALSGDIVERVREQNIADQEENRKAIYEELNKRMTAKLITAGAVIGEISCIAGVLATSSCITFALPEDRPYFTGAALGFCGLIAGVLYKNSIMTLKNTALASAVCATSVAGIVLVASRMPEFSFHYGQDFVHRLIQGLALNIAKTFTDIGIRKEVALSSLASDHLYLAAGTALVGIGYLYRGGMTFTKAFLATTCVGLAYAFVNTTYGAQLTQNLFFNVAETFTSLAERYSNNTVASLMGRAL